MLWVRIASQYLTRLGLVRSLCCALVSGLVASVPLAAYTGTDTFDFLSYNPPKEWIKESQTDGISYRRPAGVGLIKLYKSRPSAESASNEFSRTWSSYVASLVPGPPPQPEIQRDGDYTAAVGSRLVNAKGTNTAIGLVVFVGRGRAMGVLTMSAGDEAQLEITSFLNSISVSLKSVDPLGASSIGEVEVDFDVPPGYVSGRDGRAIVLKPTTLGETTPCIYGFSPPRLTKGDLERDARAALLEALPGWQIKNENYEALRGTSGTGWSYFLFRTDVQSVSGGSYQYLSAMAMAFPATAGRVNIMWGFGSPAHCTLDNHTFAIIFDSLHPRGWMSDGGKSIDRYLLGTWRNSQRLGIAQYRFMSGGRYEYGIGTTTTTGIFERTSASASDGRYQLNGNQLTITPDRRDRVPLRYRVRVFEKYLHGRWWPNLGLLDIGANRVGEVLYERVE